MNANHHRVTFNKQRNCMMAELGVVNITAKKVDITESREASAAQTETKFKQSGLTVRRTIGENHWENNWRTIGEQLENNWRTIGEQLENNWGQTLIKSIAITSIAD